MGLPSEESPLAPEGLVARIRRASAATSTLSVGVVRALGCATKATPATRSSPVGDGRVSSSASSASGSGSWQQTWRRATRPCARCARAWRPRRPSSPACASAPGRGRAHARGGARRGVQQPTCAEGVIALAESRHADEPPGAADAMQSLRERIAAETAQRRCRRAALGVSASSSTCSTSSEPGLRPRKPRQGRGRRREGSARALTRAWLRPRTRCRRRAVRAPARAQGARARLHAEREAVLKKVDELRAHVDELSRICKRRRWQWRELWDLEYDLGDPARGAAMGRRTCAASARRGTRSCR